MKLTIISYKALSFLRLSLLVMLLHACHYAQEGNNCAQLNQRVTIRVQDYQDYTIENILRNLSYLKGIPLGFIESEDNPSLRRKINLDLTNRPLCEILDRIVAADDRYQWALVDGVINVFPKNIDERALAYLRIESLTLAAIDLANVGEYLLAAPEIRSELERRGKKSTSEFKYVGPPIKKTKVTIKLTSVTISEGLNQLVNAGQFRFWELIVIGAQREFVQINVFAW